MRKITLPVALGVAILISRRNAVRAVRQWVEVTLAEIDEALALTWDEGEYDEDEPCICGSTEHRATKTAILEMPAWLDNPEHGVIPLQAEFQYSEQDPLAVSLKLTLNVYKGEELFGADEQTWNFARDLLDTALSTDDRRMVGDGDVKVQYDPEQDELWVWMKDLQEVEHRVTMAAGAVRQFMATSFRIVPAGTETYDSLDTEIASAFGEGQQ
jgi:hypothetical protein